MLPETSIRDFRAIIIFDMVTVFCNRSQVCKLRCASNQPPHCRRLQGAADARRRARGRTFVLQVPDNKADAVPCERLQFFCQLFALVPYIPIGLRCMRRYRHVSRQGQQGIRGYLAEGLTGAGPCFWNFQEHRCRQGGLGMMLLLLCLMIFCFQLASKVKVSFVLKTLNYMLNLTVLVWYEFSIKIAIIFRSAALTSTDRFPEFKWNRR
jgi:hypothetical protein